MGDDADVRLTTVSKDGEPLGLLWAWGQGPSKLGICGVFASWVRDALEVPEGSLRVPVLVEVDSRKCQQRKHI